MLHGHGRKRPDFVALVAKRRRVPGCAPDEKYYLLDSGSVFQPGQPITDPEGSQLRASFIKRDTIAPFALGEEGGGFVVPFQEFKVKRHVVLQPPGIFPYALPSVAKLRLSDSEDP